MPKRKTLDAKPTAMDLPAFLEKLKSCALWFDLVSFNKIRDPREVEVQWKDEAQSKSTICLPQSVADTIIDILKLPNPILPPRYLANPIQLSSPIKRWPKIRNISPWTDFTGDNLRACLPHLYDIPTGPCSVVDYLRDYRKQTIFPWRHEWARVLLLKPFELASKKAYQDLGVDNKDPPEFIYRWAWDKDPNFRVTNGRLGIWNSGEYHTSYRLLVAGDIVHRRGWRLQDAVDEGCDMDSRGRWPLMEVASFCLLSSTRYGMIITEEQVVILEFWWEDTDKDGRGIMSCRYCCAPWENQQSTSTTALEALFGITMLSLYDRYRRVRKAPHPYNIADLIAKMTAGKPGEKKINARTAEKSAKPESQKRKRTATLAERTSRTTSDTRGGEWETIAERVKARPKRQKRL